MPGDKRKISVVILAYNEEKNIERCVRAILDQTYRPFEIIVVNDGSTDNTIKKLKIFGKKIKIINKKKNEGRSKAYCDGFNKTKGTHVAFMDGDSYAPQNWLKCIVNELNKSSNNTACIGGYYKGHNTKSKIPQLENKYNKIAVQIGLFKFPSGTNMIYDKKICQKAGIFRKLPRFRCDRYAMDVLKKQKYKIKITKYYVFSKVPETIRGYLKQRFRWGRGAPNAGLTNVKTTLQKFIIILLPIILILGFIVYPYLFLKISILCILFAILLIIGLSFKWKIKITDLLELLILKSMSYYAHAAGYIFELVSIRK